MNVLYLCYQSVTEPLTRTQVIAYLEGLAADGHRIVLLTFEPWPLSAKEDSAWQERLAGLGIIWHWLRYHKRPTVPATAWDVLAGVVFALGLVRKHRVQVFHARGHVPGLMALALKRLTRGQLLFDVRGFMAEEYADAGVWPAGGRLFRITKRVERTLVRSADGIVVLTHRAKGLLEGWYPREVAGKPVEIIPCCVDFRQLPPAANGERTAGSERPSLAYAGKLGGWYLTEAMVEFFAFARRSIPGLYWQVWTQSDPAPLRRLLEARQLADHVQIGRASPEALPGELGKARAALSFIKPCLSKLASSPTKVGEYLAAGLPVVSTAGIGDLDSLLGESGGGDGAVGVVVRECSEEGYREALPRLLRLLEDPGTPARCRAAAREFDLETVGWSRYRALYRMLGGDGPGRAVPRAEAAIGRG
jgi:glycosyltransferase involved in cell wall biosynthesis